MFELDDVDFSDDIFESDVLDQISKDVTTIRKDPFAKPAATVPKKTHKVVKQKFPGPAGLLPEMQDLNVDITKLESDFKEDDSNNEYLCSQNSVSKFCENTWLKASEDLKNSNLDAYNIAWIVDKAKTGKLINSKAPFLVASIKKVECVSKTPTFILVDPTGEIEAVISEELYDELTEYLTINSVIVLKQFSVLTMNNSKKRYVIITLKNLIKIYSFRQIFGEESGNVEILNIQDISNDDIVRDIGNIKEKYRDFIAGRTNSKQNYSVVEKIISKNDPKIGDGKFEVMDFNVSDVDFSGDFPVLESSKNTKTNQEKARIDQNTNISSIFESSDFNLDETSFGALDFDTPPSKKIKATTSKFVFKSKLKTDTSNTENVDKNQNSSPKRIDCSQISILSQNKENLDEIRNALSGLDANTLFEDF